MHRVAINADRYTPVDSEMLPTGEMAAVGGTKFDLRIARRLESVEEGLLARHHVTGTLFDHNFVLNRKEGGGGLTFAARVESGERGGRCVLKGFSVGDHPRMTSATKGVEKWLNSNGILRCGTSDLHEMRTRRRGGDRSSRIFFG